ncbi:MAG: rod-binding protein [Pseudomonadota bacterium]
MDALSTFSATDTSAAKLTDPMRRTAEDYEGIFLSTLLQTMFADLEVDGPFGGGHSEKIYRSMMVDQYGTEIAKRGGIGIADAITRELLAFQELKS